MVIDPFVVLIAGSAAAIAIIVFAAYKSTEHRAESTRIETAGTAVSSSPTTESAERIAVSIENGTHATVERIPETYVATSMESSIEEAQDDHSTLAVNEPEKLPQQIINLAPPTIPVSPQIVDTPIEFQTHDELDHPTDENLSDTTVAKSEPLEEAPSPFPEDSFASSAAPQTPAPTDVSAVENIAAPNTSASATPTPVLVISTPKRRQAKSRKVPSAAPGIPRKKRNPKPRQSGGQSVSIGSSSGTVSSSSSSDTMSDKQI